MSFMNSSYTYAMYFFFFTLKYSFTYIHETYIWKYEDNELSTETMLSIIKLYIYITFYFFPVGFNSHRQTILSVTTHKEYPTASSKKYTNIYVY